MRNAKLIAVASVLSFVAGAGAMWAQQQAQQSHREEQFENSELKVWKTTVLPKAPLALHRHDHGRALVALTDGVLQVQDKNGKVLDTYNLKAGKAMWLGKDPPGQMHADVNPGTKPVEVIVVQLQNDK
jgi:quercetin dioxygenase-like cupin family protein